MGLKPRRRRVGKTLTITSGDDGTMTVGFNDEQSKAIYNMASLLHTTPEQYIRDALKEKIESDGQLIGWARRMERAAKRAEKRCKK